MRDPYHAARQRFKVARDRLIEAVLHRCNFVLVSDPSAFSGSKLFCYHRLTPAQQRRLRDAPLKAYLTDDVDTGYHNLDELLKAAKEAAGILLTMEKWGITDEHQALMLWKLSRD